MAKINLLRKSSSFDESVSSYRLVLEVTSSEDISSKIFVCQRLHDYVKNTFDDVFAAVCTPVQLEDLPADVPQEGTSYYRTDKVDILSRNPEYLEEVFDDIVACIQRLVRDFESLEVLEEDGTYEIDAGDVTINP